jgi:hypothetical protein
MMTILLTVGAIAIYFGFAVLIGMFIKVGMGGDTQ